MSECTPSITALPSVKKRNLIANFNGGNVSGDGGSLLLNLIDKKLDLTRRVGKILDQYDPRQKSKIEHKNVDLARQRIYGLACGYEDLNDHDELRNDINFQTSVGTATSLASSSTLCRFENRSKQSDVCKEISKLLVEQFVESFEKAPQELTLDFDATDDLVHGNQEKKFFHGYYKSYCFLPLYVFCEDQLLVSYLRPSNIDGAKHTWAILALLVKRFRKKWPNAKVTFRGDGGFCRWRMLQWCEKNDVQYIVGYTKNKVVQKLSEVHRKESEETYQATQQTSKIFGEFQYAAKTWDKERKIIVKAEHNCQGANTRYIITNMEGEPRDLYSKIYCARGDMENRIKEQQLGLFADRTSCSEWWANQFRLLLSSLAYVLIERLRNLALKGTDLARAQASTIRLKLFKIGAVIRRNTRSIYLNLSSNYPYKKLFCRVLKTLTKT